MTDHLIDIELEDGRSSFEDLHDLPDESRFLARLALLVQQCSGHMANTAIELLCQGAEDYLIEDLQRERKVYITSARGCLSRAGAHKEYHEAFATIYAAAACLLVETEYAPWTYSELQEAILECEAQAIRTAERRL